jgi:hypothetical protein
MDRSPIHGFNGRRKEKAHDIIKEILANTMPPKYVGVSLRLLTAKYIFSEAQKVDTPGIHRSRSADSMLRPALRPILSISGLMLPK